MLNFDFWSENLGLFADPSVIARLSKYYPRLASWCSSSPIEQVYLPDE